MNKNIANIIFTTFIFILFTAAAIDALTFSRLAQFFPLYISAAGAILSFIYLIKIIIEHIKHTSPDDRNERLLIVKPLKYIAWIIGYLMLIYIVGMLIATGIFLFIFLILESKMKVLSSILAVSVMLVLITYLSAAIDIAWPTSLLGL